MVEPSNSFILVYPEASVLIFSAFLRVTINNPCSSYAENLPIFIYSRTQLLQFPEMVKVWDWVREYLNIYKHK